jgi:hypothetical protein
MSHLWRALVWWAVISAAICITFGFYKALNP